MQVKISVVQLLAVAVEALKVLARLAPVGLCDRCGLAVLGLHLVRHRVRLVKQVQRVNAQERHALEQLRVVLVQQVHDNIVRRKPRTRKHDALAVGVRQHNVLVHSAAKRVHE